jgi:hypothetical protein
VSDFFTLEGPRPGRFNQLALGLQPVLDIMTVLAAALEKQLVGAAGDGFRQRVAAARQSIIPAS